MNGFLLHGSACHCSQLCLGMNFKTVVVLFQLNNLSILIPSLIACELAVDSSSNWRLHVELLEKFSCFPKCLTSDQIYYKFVPLFFRLLSSNVSVLRFIAGYNVTLLFLEMFVWYSVDRFQWTLILTKDYGLIIFLCSFSPACFTGKIGSSAHLVCVHPI